MSLNQVMLELLDEKFPLKKTEGAPKSAKLDAFSDDLTGFGGD